MGLALAKLLITKTNYRLVLTARASSLHRFSEQGIQGGARVMLAALDITDHDMRVKLIDEVAERWNGVDVLINNAGVSYRSVVVA